MDRTKLSLDFTKPRKAPKFGFREYSGAIQSNTSVVGATNCISSPEFSRTLLKLSTPELDRIFVPLTPIPTPVYLSNSNISEADQEAYTKGFVDAVIELHRQQVAKVWGSTTTVIPSLVALTPVSPYKAPYEADPCEVSNSTPINLTTTDRGHEIPNSNSVKEQQQVLATPEEEQNLPILTAPLVTTSLISPSSSASSSFCKLSLGSSNESNTPLKHHSSDFDKTERELVRLARRREKNRNAARKCRTKKLERIACLEDQVKRLKDENSQLANVLNKHKRDVYSLQKNLSDHINNKNCKLFPNGKSRH